jgi:hypothetical protein
MKDLLSSNEAYLLKDLKRNIQYEIYGHKNETNTFICTEIMEIDYNKNKINSFLNSQLTFPEAQKIINTLFTIVKEFSVHSN